MHPQEQAVVHDSQLRQQGTVRLQLPQQPAQHVGTHIALPNSAASDSTPLTSSSLSSGELNAWQSPRLDDTFGITELQNA